jgi:hypothetical protein
MIVLVDTSVFCNVIDLPGFNQDRDAVLNDFREYVEAGASLLLPVVVFYETGNHIGQLPNGQIRDTWARALRNIACEALNGDAPWTPTPLPTKEQLSEIFGDFPESAVIGCGFGDHTIIKEQQRIKRLSPGRTIKIWTLDQQLAAFGDP